MEQRGGETLVFEVDGRCFGLPASAVRELVRAVAIVPLPMAGPGVEGVVNLRGQVVPVIDLRERLGLPSRTVMPSDHLIVARSGDILAALRVDRALDLVRLDAASDESSSAATGMASEGTKVARLADGLAPLLDLREVFHGVAAPETLGVASGVTDAAETETKKETEGGAP